MRKRIYFFTLILLFLTGQIVNAQVTIGSQENPRATLDIRATNAGDNITPEGVIFPHLTRADLDRKVAVYTENLKGTIVYVSSISGTSTTTSTSMITSEGYYFLDGSKIWQPIAGVVAGTLRTRLIELTLMMENPEVNFENGDFIYITSTAGAIAENATAAITKPGYYYWSGTSSEGVWTTFEGSGEDNLLLGTGLALNDEGTHITHVPHTGDVHGSTVLTIQDNAVTADKIKDGEVTAAKLAAGAITADKLDAGAVTVDKLAGGEEAGQVLTTDASGNAVWQAPAGAAGPERMKFESKTSAYTITLADENKLIITESSSGVTITFPNLGAENAGFRVFVYNANPGGAMNIYTFLPSAHMTPATAGSNGGWLLWTGSIWLPLSKS